MAESKVTKLQRIAFWLFLVVVCPFTSKATCASELAGQATVIDGDTIEIHGLRVRLFGVNVPESRQTCEAGGQVYRCGQEAAFALADHIGRQVVSCTQKDIDRYGRIVAVCRVADEDIAAWLVEQGWALAFRRYSDEYVSQERTAREAKRGVWRGEFLAPWEWRKAARSSS